MDRLGKLLGYEVGKNGRLVLRFSSGDVELSTVDVVYLYDYSWSWWKTDIGQLARIVGQEPWYVNIKDSGVMEICWTDPDYPRNSCLLSGRVVSENLKIGSSIRVRR